MVDVSAALALIEAGRLSPFAWGRHANDCVSFACAVIHAHRGHDPLAGLDWHDEASALALIAAMGGFEAAVSSRLTPIDPAMAHRFDAAMVDVGQGPMLMTIEGDMLIGPGPDRQRRLPRRLAARAWTARGLA